MVRARPVKMHQVINIGVAVQGVFAQNSACCRVGSNEKLF